MAGSDITIEILKDIRDAVRATNTRVDATNERLEAVESTLTQHFGALETSFAQRMDGVETALLDLAEQHRFVVRYTKAISERDADLGPRVSALESRVEKLEPK